MAASLTNAIRSSPSTSHNGIWPLITSASCTSPALQRRRWSARLDASISHPQASKPRPPDGSEGRVGDAPELNPRTVRALP